MTISQRVLGLVMTVMSIAGLALLVVFPMPPLTTESLTVLCGYFLVMFLPGLLIDLVFGWLGRGLDESIASKCGGLKHGGYLIGYMERSLIFLAIVISYFDSSLSYASILSFLSVIVAGKAIFRYSNKDNGDRACADWYILGTFMSITMALALSWWIFRFLLIG